MEVLIKDFFLAGNMEHVALTVAGTSIQTTGSGEQKGTPTTWLVLLASPARDSCPQEKSSPWWMRGSCVVCTMTACWTTSNVPWRMVRRCLDMLTLYKWSSFSIVQNKLTMFIPYPFIQLLWNHSLSLIPLILCGLP